MRKQKSKGSMDRRFFSSVPGRAKSTYRLLYRLRSSSISKKPEPFIIKALISLMVA